MTINIAMPIAHETSGNFNDYYVPNAAGGNDTVFTPTYFGVGISQGLGVARSAIAPAALPARLWNLYAFTDGFLSFQDNALVLRLPRELRAAATRVFNSGHLFLRLQPTGPQLRAVIYRYDGAPGTAVTDAIRTILSDVTHAGQSITRVPWPGGSRTLQAHLAALPGDLDALTQDFLSGFIDVFVRAGDVIGSIDGHRVTIEFRDSSGNINPGAANVNPVSPLGHPISPSYFLQLVRAPANAGNVNLLTGAPAAGARAHPLDWLHHAADLILAGANADLEIDLAAANPPPPLHFTTSPIDVAGVQIADAGLPLGALAIWHESRNAANPYSTRAPIRWRNYGDTAAGDTTAADFGKFRSNVKAGSQTLLPGGAAFDHDHTPTVNLRNRAIDVWTRYHRMLNRIAGRFQVPCEILVGIACVESGFVFANPLAASREMDIIRMEPLNAAVPAITAVAAHQALLNDYVTIAGGPGGAGANADIPIPWNGGALVQAPHGLTWTQLAQLIDLFPNNVRVSPGVMQTLVETARDDLEWLQSIYGPAVSSLSVSEGVRLDADAPPSTRGALFSDWFGVAVDATGNNTNVAANVDVDLTKLKRAFHDLIAGTAHLKRMYNSVAGGRSNVISDWDVATVMSAYNDRAAAVRPSTAVADDNDKWTRLFALRVYGPHYPDRFPKYFNAITEYFNTSFSPPPGGPERPAFRLWKE